MTELHEPPEPPPRPEQREQITQAPDGRPDDEQPAWRKDFPIDWPQDHYVARRDFTKFMVLTSLAFVVGHVWIGMQSFLRRRRGEPAARRIVSLKELAVGQSIIFDYPQKHDTCILVRTSVDQILAYSQKCTHLSCAVVPQLEKKCFHCPCHEGEFDLQTGRALAGPPRRPLPRIKLEIRDDVVYATGVEVSTV
ncbi:MAG TPA: ubiquinol-cytochrome c reductase iron-sulfur subunit [Tepidisphaeraceae bacterium]|jgi:Rieske Fe-S protein